MHPSACRPTPPPSSPSPYSSPDPLPNYSALDWAIYLQHDAMSSWLFIDWLTAGAQALTIVTLIVPVSITHPPITGNAPTVPYTDY